jgi:hypothetical protein
MIAADGNGAATNLTFNEFPPSLPLSGLDGTYLWFWLDF